MAVAQGPGPGRAACPRTGAQDAPRTAHGHVVAGTRRRSGRKQPAIRASRGAPTPRPGSRRRFLPPRLEGKLLALCPGGMSWVDVEVFEEAAANARRLGEPAAYRAAIEMYAGELLPQDRYEEWAEEWREGLRRDLLALLVELARLHEGRGELEPAIEVLRRVGAEEQTHEVAHAGLMRMYAIAGRRDEALKQYERLREALSRDLDTAPDAESRLLREGILAGKLPTVRPSRVEERRERSRSQHNLPAPRTSFVGREHELVEVGRLLSMTRLLTLTGRVARARLGSLWRWREVSWVLIRTACGSWSWRDSRRGRWSRRRSPGRWECASSPLGRCSSWWTTASTSWTRRLG